MEGSQPGNERAIPARDDAVSDMQARRRATAGRTPPISVREFHRMVETGEIGPDERVELLDGELILMPRVSPEHAYCANTIARILDRRLGDRAYVTCENPLALDELSQPQPDVMLSALPRERYARAHPSAEDTLLVIEVSKSTLAFDRGRKLRAYARRGIREYWIVNLVDDRIEVFRMPAGDGYAEQLAARRGEAIAPAAFPAEPIPAVELLPPP